MHPYQQGSHHAAQEVIDTLQRGAQEKDAEIARWRGRSAWWRACAVSLIFTSLLLLQCLSWLGRPQRELIMVELSCPLPTRQLVCRREPRLVTLYPYGHSDTSLRWPLVSSYPSTLASMSSSSLELRQAPLWSELVCYEVELEEPSSEPVPPSLTMLAPIYDASN